MIPRFRAWDKANQKETDKIILVPIAWFMCEVLIMLGIDFLDSLLSASYDFAIEVLFVVYTFSSVLSISLLTTFFLGKFEVKKIYKKERAMRVEELQRMLKCYDPESDVVIEDKENLYDVKGITIVRNLGTGKKYVSIVIEEDEE